jgi:hypothetical protein
MNCNSVEAHLTAHQPTTDPFFHLLLASAATGREVLAPEGWEVGGGSRRIDGGLEAAGQGRTGGGGGEAQRVRKGGVAGGTTAGSRRPGWGRKWRG